MQRQLQEVSATQVDWLWFVHLRAWDPGSDASDLVQSLPHFLRATWAPISTRPEVGAAEQVPWLPILDAESVAAQHQNEPQKVHGHWAAHEGWWGLGRAERQVQASFNRIHRPVSAWTTGHHPEGLRAVPQGLFVQDRTWKQQVVFFVQYRGAEQVAGDQGVANVPHQSDVYGRVWGEVLEVHRTGDERIRAVESLAVWSFLLFHLLARADSTVHRLVASATWGVSLPLFHDAFRSYHRARLVRVAEHAMRVGRLEQGLPELFHWRAGQRWIHGSGAAYSTCGLHAYRADWATGSSNETALEGSGPNARAFVHQCGFAHRIQVLSIPQAMSRMRVRLCQGQKERVWRHIEGVRAKRTMGQNRSDFRSLEQNNRELQVHRHVSWMCLSSHWPHVHVLHAADIELDADNGRQPIHAGASCDSLVMHGAVVLLDSALKWWARGLKIVETEQSIGVFDVAAVDLTSAWGWAWTASGIQQWIAKLVSRRRMQRGAQRSGGAHRTVDKPSVLLALPAQLEWRSLAGTMSKMNRRMPVMRRTRRSWKAMREARWSLKMQRPWWALQTSGRCLWYHARWACHGPRGGVCVWHFGHGGDARPLQRIHSHHWRNGSRTPVAKASSSSATRRPAQFHVASVR